MFSEVYNVIVYNYYYVLGQSLHTSLSSLVVNQILLNGVLSPLELHTQNSPNHQSPFLVCLNLHYRPNTSIEL